MSIELRLPNFHGSDREQLVQMRSYLYQLIPQLQWALNNTAVVGTVTSSVVRPSSPTAPTPGASFDAEVAFEKLKPLIIKSADIVQAYYDEINSRLSGIYVAESDFGTFIEKTDQHIEQNSTSITQMFNNIQEIVTDIDNLDFTVANVDAHIKTGLLYYDGAIPVYGVEVGQKTAIDGVETFNKYARFTADRLSFYDQNDSEVAYISNYKLYIRNVEITSSIKIGGLKDSVTASGDVVSKWIGGDG